MRQIWRGARIFDGAHLHEEKILVVNNGQIEAIVSTENAPEGAVISLDGGILAPGFVDMQVNGGGGRLLGQGAPDDALRKMSAAHLAMGTTAFLPTLITSDAETLRATLSAVRRAVAEEMPAIVGVHLEGPFLDPRRKGAHDAGLFRPMTDADLALLLDAAQELPVLMVTLAPANATLEQIAALAAAGVVVMLGHSECSEAEARAGFEAGAAGVTHLYNAMSPLTHRAAGLVGAALDSDCWAGIIPDGEHVGAAAFRIACRAKPGRLVAVTDAMAVAGSTLSEFTLNDRRILRRDGRLTLEDGTLAGADVNFPQALRWMVREAGLALEDALAMMTLAPAQLLGLDTRGRIAPGHRADLVHLDDDLGLQQVWRAGQVV